MIELILSLCGTLFLYYLVRELYRQTGSLWLLPITACPVIIGVFLVFFHIPYESYEGGGHLLQWLLSPATVAFAIPLYRQRKMVRRYLPELIMVGVIASITAILTTMTAISLFGLDQSYILSLAPRSITTPIAMEVSTMLGGNATITAIFVIFTGVLGMLMSVFLIKTLKINNPILRGLLLGFSAHGTGTAKAYEYDEKTGVIASMAMIFLGVITALLAPFLVPAVFYLLGW